MSKKLRVRFMFASEPNVDNKTTVVKIKRLQIDGEDEVYGIPPELQDLQHHKELLKAVPAKNAKKALTVRNKIRNPFIPLDDELRAVYLDKAGNPTFKDEQLD